MFEKYRKLSVTELTHRGFSLVGGSSRAMSNGYAEAQVARVTDKQIAERLGWKGGKLGTWFRMAWQWIKDNKETILKIISIILSLAMLFLQSEAPVNWTPSGDGFERNGFYVASEGVEWVLYTPWKDGTEHRGYRAYSRQEAVNRGNAVIEW